MNPLVLTRREIITAFCFLREAERSIHRVLNPACRWSDFVAYYTPAKKAGLHELAHRFQPILQVPGGGFPTQQDSLNVHGPKLLAIFQSVCFGRWKRTWRFSPDEIAYIGAVFGAIIRLLEIPAKPALDDLIGARMATYNAERIIQDRCLGLYELRRAIAVAHFNDLPWGPTPTVSDILRDVA